MSIVLRVNTTTKEIIREELKEEYRFLGGRSLIARVLTDEVDPTCDPLGAENKLILCTTLLAGTTLPMAHRLSAGGKSPLTGGIKEANSGGTAASLLARHGIKMIILEGLPQTNDWYILHIQKDGSSQLVDATDYVGLNNYDLAAKIQERFGKNVGIISIGLAGERGYRNSTLQLIDASTGYPSRAAARGGLGAVMGAKKIKAVVIERAANPYEFPYADKERYEAVRKKYIQRVLSSPRTESMQKVGTMSMIDFTSTVAALPVRNFSGQFFEQAEAIKSKAFVERAFIGGGRNKEGCQPGCIVRCSNRFHTKDGEYLTSGLEYETVALCGANCGIADFDVIARLDRMCDDLGVDTIETGATIAVCMEAGKISFGDGEGAIALLQEMIDGTEFGRLLGQGTEAVGKALGVKRIPTVKGQALPAYDPRSIKGLGVTYATSAMGADHTAGMTLGPGIDPSKKDFQVERSRQSQMVAAVTDSFTCSFGWGELNNEEILPEIMASLYGGEWTYGQIMNIGKETLKLERAFNQAAGLTEVDDCLPAFFYNEISAIDTVFDISAEEMQELFNY
ncbi:MAG: aldehyde ferredoxin oxidoreductase [Firmicutes bacterium]|nr:aldehyde ferredoxin oxidoreductase [Bacillota bacterium]